MTDDRAIHAGKTFYDEVRVERETLDYLSLSGTMCHDRASLRNTTVDGPARLDDATMYHALYAWQFDAGYIDAESVHVHGAADFRSAETSRFHAPHAEFSRLNLQRLVADHVDLHHTTIGTLRLEYDPAQDDRPVYDLRGATVDTLHVDDIDAHTFRVDPDTTVEEIVEGVGRPVDYDLGPSQAELVEKISERPLFPVDRYDGSVFAYDDLKRDIVMDAERRGAFASLVRDDIVRPLDDAHYALVNARYG